MFTSTLPHRSMFSTFGRCLRSESRQGFAHRSRITTSSTEPRIQESRLRKGGTAKRAFGTTSSRAYKTVEEQRSRYRSGVCFYLLVLSSCPLILASYTVPFLYFLLHSSIQSKAQRIILQSHQKLTSTKQPFSWKAGLLLVWWITMARCLRTGR